MRASTPNLSPTLIAGSLLAVVGLGILLALMKSEHHEGEQVNGAVAVGVDAAGHPLVRTAVCWGDQAEFSVMVEREGAAEPVLIGSGTDTLTTVTPGRSIDSDRTIDLTDPGSTWTSSRSLDAAELAVHEGRVLIVGTDTEAREPKDDRDWTDHTLAEWSDWRAVPVGLWLTTSGDGDEPRPDGYLTSEEFHHYACG